MAFLLVYIMFLAQGVSLVDEGQSLDSSGQFPRSGVPLGEQPDRLEFSIQDEYLVQNFTVEDGLPVNSIDWMVQDDDGYIWFTSLDGLIRYDGYEFRIYNSANTPGLNSNRISGIAETGPNEFWLTHEDGSLTHRKDASFTSYSSSINNFPGSAWRMETNRHGQIWVGTHSNLTFFNARNGSFELIGSPLLQTHTYALENTDDNKLLIFNEKGLILLDEMKASLLLTAALIEEKIPTNPGGLNLFSASDRAWLYNRSVGLGYSRSKKTPTFLLRFTSDTEAVFTDLANQEEQIVRISSHEELRSAASRIGITERELLTLMPEYRNMHYKRPESGTNFGGDSILAGTNQITINGRSVLEQKELRIAFVDRENSLWVSSRSNGIFHIRKSIVSNIGISDVPGLNNIYSIIQNADGAVTACGFTEDIYQFRNNHVIRWNSSNSNKPDNNCRSLYEDSAGNLYAGFWGSGLWQYRENEWRQIPKADVHQPEERIPEVMFEDRNGRLLVGTRGRMFIVKNNMLELFSAEQDHLRGIRVIRENEQGDLFFGSRSRGLITHRRNGKKIQYTVSKDGISSDLIRDIYLQSADTLWLATENHGLNRLVFDRAGTLVSTASVTTEDGLISNSTHRIIRTPDDHLWISSNGGIMRIPEDNLNEYTDGHIQSLSVLTLDESDGMTNREANGGVQTAGLLADDGRLWFPNQSGITIIDPLEIDGPGTFMAPRPVIEQISVSDSVLAVYQKAEITIPKGSRNIRIKFTAPNSNSPERVQFRYKLSGVNDGWENGNQNREAVLTNIPPGTHEFQLMVYRPENTAVISEASVLIHVPYFFFETAWFKILLGLLGLLALFAGIKYRTRVLEQREQKLKERVHQQTEELKKAADHKSRFFSGITHELKTPLSLIVSPLEDILEGPQQIPIENTRDRLELMQRNSKQLQNLVDQILDVTKLNANAMRLTVRPVNITELTRQIAGQFQSKLEMEEISLKFQSDFIEEGMYVDPGAWEQIIINLLTNAIRFSPKGASIRIDIRDLGDRVCLAVKDKGIGIDAKEQDKVFEYLYQVAGDKAAEGTGIGLYLVRGLVEQMGGQIHLISNKEEGAEFIIILKKGFGHFRDTDTIIHEAVTNRSSGVPMSDQVKTSSANSNPPDAEKILVVEDNFDYRNYLLSLLSVQYEVAVAPEGERALEILEKKKIDLVISDVMMPGMNGLEFVSNLRKREEYKQLPVIFLSAKDQEIDMEQGLSSGADIYLAKPIKSTLLMSQIDAILRREKILNTNYLELHNGKETELIREVREIVYRQLANPALNPYMLADALYTSRASLYREWAKVSDTTLHNFIKKIRLDEANTLLKEGRFSVKEAAMAVGYSDANYFSTSFKKEFGVNPSEVKK